MHGDIIMLYNLSGCADFITQGVGDLVKKFLATACAAVMTASMLVMSASAGVGDIKYEIKGTNKAPVIDGEDHAG